jgi:polysaccharide biosynthesis protein VpsQ
MLYYFACEPERPGGQKGACDCKNLNPFPPAFMKLKWLTIIYALFLVVLVVLASQKQYLFLFRFVRRTPHADKVGHLLLMGLLSFLVNLAISCKRIKIGRVQLLAGSLLVGLVVTLEELSQIFLRYRSFDLIDLAFDYAGILLFGYLACRLMKFRPARQDKTC